MYLMGMMQHSLKTDCPSDAIETKHIDLKRSRSTLFFRGERHLSSSDSAPTTMDDVVDN